jgi:nucleotide-binding universal stress UspA family protein
MFKRRNWLDWLVIGIIVIAVAGVGVYAYQSYRESREKKEAQAEAQAAFETYGNAVVDVRRSYIRAYNKVWDAGGDEENYGLLNRVAPWANKLQRAVRALAAIESPDQFADAHAALEGAWRKEVPFIRDHLKTANRVFDNEPTGFLDFDAMDAWTKRLQKEIDTILKADKRVEAAWEKWLAAANQEAKRLGVTVSGD